MSRQWDGSGQDSNDAPREVAQLTGFVDSSVGEALTIANEFTEVQVRRIDTRNGSRLLITAPKSRQWITLDPLEIEALTWQNSRTLAAMVGNTFAPLLPDEDRAP